MRANERTSHAPSGERTGGNEPASRNEKATEPMLSYAVSTARDGRRSESAQVTEPPEESADGKAVHTGREEEKQPKGEVRQVSHGKDATGREMRTAETILNILQDRGKRPLPLDDVYRQLYHPDMSLRSYARLYRNNGAMPPGITEETVDGWSGEKGAKILEASREERWQWTPVKRAFIDKPTGGKRPLGLPVWAEKVGQDIIRAILAAYDAPQCSTYSHGCRPKRGCHTALNEVVETWMGSQWFSAGDSKGCVETIDHAILMNILRESIQDNRCLRLIEGALKAGDCAAWTFHPSLSGSPQGGRVSPRLSHISMHRFERFVHDTVIPE